MWSKKYRYFPVNAVSLKQEKSAVELRWSTVVLCSTGCWLIAVIAPWVGHEVVWINFHQHQQLRPETKLKWRFFKMKPSMFELRD